MFTNALLQGLGNSCTVTGADTCHQTLPNDLTGLLGDSSSGLANYAGFLSDNGADGEAGFIEYTHEGDFGSVFKSNEGTSISGLDAPGDNVGWLLYRTQGSNVPPPTNVPEPGTLALFGVGLAGLGVMRRRRVAWSRFRTRLWRATTISQSPCR